MPELHGGPEPGAGPRMMVVGGEGRGRAASDEAKLDLVGVLCCDEC